MAKLRSINVGKPVWSGLLGMNSQLDAVHNKHTLYVYSSHATVDLTVDQKDRAPERACSPLS